MISCVKSICLDTIIGTQVLGAPPESLVAKGERSYKLIDRSGKPRYCTVFKVSIDIIFHGGDGDDDDGDQLMDTNGKPCSWSCLINGTNDQGSWCW